MFKKQEGFSISFLQVSSRFPTWWFIPLSKWVVTPVINGISRVNPLITGVITHLRAVGWATKYQPLGFAAQVLVSSMRAMLGRARWPCALPWWLLWGRAMTTSWPRGHQSRRSGDFRHPLTGTLPSGKPTKNYGKLQFSMFETIKLLGLRWFNLQKIHMFHTVCFHIFVLTLW